VEDIGTDFYKTVSEDLKRLPFVPDTNWEEFAPYSAKEATQKQVDYFNKFTN